MKEQYVLTVKAEDRPGLLHLVTGVINRKLIGIESLTASKTDIHDIVLITLEIHISEKALTPLLYKLKNIIEVFDVDAQLKESAITLCAAFFKLDKAYITTPNAAQLWKNGAQLINLYPEAILVSKTGREAEIKQLYNILDGEHLLGFSQTGIIAESKLIEHADEERIIGLAA